MAYIVRIFISTLGCFIASIIYGQSGSKIIALKDSLDVGIEKSRDIKSNNRLTNNFKSGDSSHAKNKINVIKSKSDSILHGSIISKLMDITHKNSLLHQKSKSSLDSCNCNLISSRKDSLAKISQQLKKLDSYSMLTGYIKKKMKDISDAKAIYNKSDGVDHVRLLKITYVDMTEQLLVQPYLYADSVSPLIQNIVRSSFAFQIKDKYLFNGFAQYRNTLKGTLPNFWDFSIVYAGNKSSLSTIKKNAGGIFQNIQELEKTVQNAINQIDSAIKEMGRDFVSGYSQQLLDARQLIGNFSVDSSYQYVDSAKVACARELISSYDMITREIESLQSKQGELQNLLGKIKGAKGNELNIEKIFNDVLGYGNNRYEQNHLALDNSYAYTTQALADKLKITKLGLGRVCPVQSELTLKNTSLRGVDFGIQKRHWVISISAGVSDFNVNTFWSRTRMVKPMPYAGVAGVSYNINKHISAGLRYFTGRKDNYSASISRNIISGLSAEISAKKKNGVVSIELAKNLSQPSLRGVELDRKRFWDMKDYENMAVAINSSISIAKTKTTISGSYVAQGKYYNAFNTLSSNIQTRRYDLRFKQDLLKGVIRMTAWIRNSEFTPVLNGMVIQNDVSLTSVNISFQKAKLPMLSIGYNPVKQVFTSDSIVEVAIYQALTFIGSEQYKIGTRPASLLVSMSQLGGRKTEGSQGYLASSVNLQVSNRIDFTNYSSIVEIGVTDAREYKLLNASSGLDIQLPGAHLLKLGLSIFKFGDIKSSAGGWAAFETKIGNRGSALINYRLNYVPSIDGMSLRSFNQGNILFRYQIIK